MVTSNKTKQKKDYQKYALREGYWKKKQRDPTNKVP